MGYYNGLPLNVAPPMYTIQYPSDRASFVVNFTAVAPTVQADLFAIESGAVQCFRLQRIVIDNPGMQGAAGLVNLQLMRTTTAGTAGVVTAAPLDPGNAGFSGIARVMPTALGTGGTVIAVYSLWVPGAVGAFNPLVIDMGGQGMTYQQPTSLPGPTNGIVLRHPGAAGAASFTGYAVFCEEPLIVT